MTECSTWLAVAAVVLWATLPGCMYSKVILLSLLLNVCVGSVDLIVYLCDVKSHRLGETWTEFLCLDTRKDLIHETLCFTITSPHKAFIQNEKPAKR